MNNPKIQMAIYRIDKEIFVENTNDKIIKKIIDKYNSDQKPKEKFIPQEIKDKRLQEFDLNVYYCESNTNPNWQSFFKSILKPEQSLLGGFNHTISFIAFIFNENSLYALFGGHQGYFCIIDYIDNNFGMEILSRIVSKESRVIKEAQDRGLVGSILGSTKFFRDTYTFYDDEEFGKFYKQIKTALGRDLLEREFSFDKKDLRKKTGCIAKSSFQINKSITFEHLERILIKIEDILSRKPNFEINKVKLINRRIRKNKDLLGDLENTLYTTLSNQLKTASLIDFDLCHSDYEQYLSASRFAIFKRAGSIPIKEYDELKDVNFLFEELLSSDLLSNNDLITFKDSIESVYIESYDSDGEIQTPKTSLIKHLHGEISHRNNSYFYLDSEWYEIQSNFIKELNEGCIEVLSTSLENKILPKVFSPNKNGKYIEDDYVGSYYNEKNTLLLHKVTHENIELCDILKYTDNELYLIHIKQGFDNSVRDLVNQIEMSAKRIFEDIKSAGNHRFLRGIYSGLNRNKSVGNPKSYMEKVYSQKISEDEFINLFSNKTINCCFAFVDTAKTERNILDDIKNFKSNIAKCSLLGLNRKLLDKRFVLKVMQIFKE